MSAWIHTHADCVAEGLSPTVGAELRILHAEGESIYASRGLKLYQSTDGARNFRSIGYAPGDVVQRGLARTPLTARVLRTGFHSLAPLPSGDLLACVRGAILHRAADGMRFHAVHEVVRGRRPLGICVHPSGRSYFGEYFSNPGREEVHIYGSDNGRRWDVVGTFPEQTVRHVHNIIWDPHREGMWVLTGDDGDESALWWTEDEFRTLTPVLRGVQQARAVTLFPLESGLILPMDSPFETNYVQHFDPQSGQLDSLAPLPGSVFHGTRTGSLWLLSTAVEKSAVNTDDRPALYASANGYDWQLVSRLYRDFPLLARTGCLFQWPTLVLPTGHSSLEHVFASGQSLRGAHGRLLSWSTREISALLKDREQRHSA